MDRLTKAPLSSSSVCQPAVADPTGSELSAEERAVLQAIRATSYGAVEVVLHQSRIVQIVKTEKVRVQGTAVSF